MFNEIIFSVIGLVSLLGYALIFSNEKQSDVSDATVNINNYMNKSMQATSFPSNLKKVS